LLDAVWLRLKKKYLNNFVTVDAEFGRAGQGRGCKIARGEKIGILKESLLV
jgi:hypothetical protein